MKISNIRKVSKLKVMMVKNPNPKRSYPWGDEPDPSRSNYVDTGIGATSAVGCFPGGTSPYGVMDLAGNVWEWTRSLWGKKGDNPDFRYPYNPNDGREDLKADSDISRVLRGASFSNNERLIRYSSRYRDLPSNWNGFLGFRVVVSPL